MRKLAELALPIEPIAPEEKGDTVYRRFQGDPDLLALAVVDADRRPVGIVERNTFFLRMAALHGRELYARRPISMLMNPQPLVAEGDIPLSDWLGAGLADRPSDLLHGFVVTREGAYLGVGSALGMLQAAHEAERERASELTQLAERLEIARKQAQASLDAKARFLAVMSHEIRTPLNGVLAVAEILGIKLRDETLAPYVGAIVSSGQTLLRLLNDILDLSRAEANELDLSEEPFEVARLLVDVSSLWAARAAQKGLALSFAYDGPEDLCVLGDPVRLKQILNNLVGNAVKFTETGGVDIRLCAEVEDIYATLRATVTDTGPGVAADKLQAIFAPFVQDDAGRSQGGTGLGLAVCRQLVERMDGAIRAEPADGGGLRIAFDAQFYRLEAGPDEADQPAEALIGGRPLHVLIADDNETNRLVAGTLCEMFGFSFEAVADGSAAVSAALRQDFDLILMDIKMPVMDGVEATRLLRAAGGAAATTPILALTANADPWDAEQYLSEGMDGVVEKPIKPQALLAAINRVLAEPSAPLAQPAPEPARLAV